MLVIWCSRKSLMSVEASSWHSATSWVCSVSRCIVAFKLMTDRRCSVYVHYVCRRNWCKSSALTPSRHTNRLNEWWTSTFTSVHVSRPTHVRLAWSFSMVNPHIDGRYLFQAVEVLFRIGCDQPGWWYYKLNSTHRRTKRMHKQLRQIDSPGNPTSPSWRHICTEYDDEVGGYQCS
jgi:hypothetical protein